MEEQHEKGGQIEELQARHREEALQQQQYHLQQLKLLQDKLLSDLMEQITVDESVSEDMKKGILQSLGLVDTIPTIEDTIPITTDTTEDTVPTIMGPASLVTMTISQPPSNVTHPGWYLYYLVSSIHGTYPIHLLYNITMMFLGTYQSLQLPLDKNPHTDTIDASHDPIPYVYRHSQSPSSAHPVGVAGTSPRPVRWSPPNDAALLNHHHGNTSIGQSDGAACTEAKDQYHNEEENERLQLTCEQLQSQVEDYNK